MMNVTCRQGTSSVYCAGHVGITVDETFVPLDFCLDTRGARGSSAGVAMVTKRVKFAGRDETRRQA